MKKALASVAITATLLLLLSACGGGDSATVADKYVGTWRTPCYRDASTSQQFDYTFNKVGDAALGVTIRGTQFNNPGCVGTGALGAPRGLSMNIRGQGDAGADKVEIQSGARFYKELWLVVGNQIQTRYQGPRDAEGFPLTFAVDEVLTRR